MAKRNYTDEQIISKLREAEVKVSQGIKTAEAIRSIGETYYSSKNTAVCVQIKRKEYIQANEDIPTKITQLV